MSPHPRPFPILHLVPILGLLPGAHLLSQEAADPWTAVTSGKPELEARVRYEQVEAGGSGNAVGTLRLLAGWQTVPWKGFSALATVRAVGFVQGPASADDPGRPAIDDPRGYALEEARVSWRGQGVGLVIGRQAVAFDDHRFVSDQPWRQHHSTLDAIRLDLGPWHGLDGSLLGVVNQRDTSNNDRAQRSLIGRVAQDLPGVGLRLIGEVLSLDAERSDGDESLTMLLRTEYRQRLGGTGWEARAVASGGAQGKDSTLAGGLQRPFAHLALGAGSGDTDVRLQFTRLGQHDGIGVVTPLSYGALVGGGVREYTLKAWIPTPWGLAFSPLLQRVDADTGGELAREAKLETYFWPGHGIELGASIYVRDSQDPSIADEIRGQLWSAWRW